MLDDILMDALRYTSFATVVFHSPGTAEDVAQKELESILAEKMRSFQA